MTRPHEKNRSLVAAASACWLIFAAIATAAGIARETWLVPRIGELPAHQLGTLLVCLAFLVVIAIFVNRTRPSSSEAVTIGVSWVVAAVAFEFGFGHFVDGLSWTRLLSDYDFTRGRLLLLLWLTVAGGPFALSRGRAVRSDRDV
jgi:hypothetical protein